MTEKEALKILGITSIFDREIVEQAKQELNEVYKSDFKMLSSFSEKDNPEKFLRKIDACKFLTNDQPDQAKVFSDLVISDINNHKLDFLKLLLETVKNDNEFNYLNTEGASGNIPLSFEFGDTSYKHESRIKAVDLLLKHGANLSMKDREGKS